MSVKAVDPNAPVAIFPPNEPKPNAPYSPAVKAGGWVFVAGQLATDFKTGIAPEVASKILFSATRWKWKRDASCGSLNRP